MAPRTRRLLRLGAALLVVAAVGSPAARADDPPEGAGAGDPAAPDPVATPPTLLEGIQKAQEAGLAWLRGAQQPSGSWGRIHSDAKNYNGTDDGYDAPTASTSLAVYTLLKSGAPMTDPSVKKGFAWLKTNTKGRLHAYEISMLLLAVTATADPFKRAKESRAAGDRVRLTGEWHKWASDLVARLLAHRAPVGWRYWGPGDENAGGPQDLSSTQLAALALFAAARCGIQVAPAVWTGIIDFSIQQQEEDGPQHPRAVLPLKAAAKPRPNADPGYAPPAPSPAGDTAPKDRARGFAYIRLKAKDKSDRAASGGMTACGIGNLMLSRFMLSTYQPKAWAAVDAARVQQSVYDGLAWLDLHWDPIRNPIKGASRYHVYYLYCVERAMDLIGSRRLGEHVWYVEMTGHLLPLQNSKGFWDTKSTLGNGPVLDTCFALLFLHRATVGGIPFPSVTGGSDDPPVDNR